MGRPRNLTALSARKGKGSPAIASFRSYTLPLWPVSATATHSFTFAFIKAQSNECYVSSNMVWQFSLLMETKRHQHTVKLAWSKRSCWSDSQGDDFGIGWYPIVGLSQHWKCQLIGGQLGELQSEYEMDSISIGVWILLYKDWNKDCSQCGWNEQGDDNGVKPAISGDGAHCHRY